MELGFDIATGTLQLTLCNERQEANHSQSKLI